jgi:aspartyl protease family protein
MATHQHQEQKKLGTTMIALMWIIIFALLAVFFSDQLNKQNNPNQSPITTESSTGIKTLVLQRNRQGHYIANGSINNTPVVFMLDTGATDVSIPAKVAQKLKLKQGPSAIYQTANGPVKVSMTRLEHISLGDISLNNVRATINPGFHGDEILLGMSFLKHLEFSQRGNKLTLKQYPEGM